MTDFKTDWAVGEHRGPISTQIEVQYAGTIAAGTPLQVSGANSDGQVTVTTQTGANKIFGFALYAGVSGDVLPVLKHGVTKATITGAHSAGTNLAVKDAKIVAFAATVSQYCCTLLQTTTGSGDHTALVLVDCNPGAAGS